MTENLKVPGDVTVVGLGYVGLPLALAFAKELPTTGFDIDVSRVEEFVAGSDRNREVPEAEILLSSLTVTSDAQCIADAEFIAITVPTPVTEDHKPDLSLLESASAMIGRQLRVRSEGLPTPIIVYESTTYSGCTEEFCGPIIERASGLKAGVGFFLGYSPERTNFGDTEHTLETVIKVVSGQTPAIAKVINDTYGLIAKAGTHVVQNIKTAEASNVIENVQRDLNIALFNELSIIFDRMDIRSSAVFDAAATKQNFHRYQSGLVGGHCIPVDPYYLTYAAAKTGYDAEVVSAGRAVNESMPDCVAAKLEAQMTKLGKTIRDSTVLVLGLTFKPDITDVRNSKVVPLVAKLQKLGTEIVVHDPNVPDVAIELKGVMGHGDPLKSDERWDAVIVAVGHREFHEAGMAKIAAHLNRPGVLIDITGSFESEAAATDGISYWRP